MLKKIKKILAPALISATIIPGILSPTIIKADALDTLNNQKNQIESEKNTTQNQIDVIEEEITTLQKEVKDLEVQAEEKGELIFTTNQKLEEETAKEEKQYNEMSTRIQYMYENGKEGVYEALLSSNDISEALTKFEHFNKIYEYDRKQLDELTNTKERIAELKTQYENELNEINRLADEAKEKQKQQEEKLTQLENTINELNIKLNDVQNKIYEETQARIAAQKAAEEEAARIATQRTYTPSYTYIPETSQGGTYEYSTNESSTYVPVDNSNLTQAQQKVAYNARVGNSTFPPRYMWCAAWVSGVYNYSGITSPNGNAIDYWYKWSHTGSSDMNNIPVGAAVISNPTSANEYYGHIGIYIGDGMVASNLGYVCIESVSSFASRGGFTGWVWPNEVDLTKLP